MAQQGQGDAVWGSIEQSFIQDWDDGYQGEDMLKLNVWTPSLTGKRAVMVYFHGGGFSFGAYWVKFDKLTPGTFARLTRSSNRRTASKSPPPISTPSL